MVARASEREFLERMQRGVYYSAPLLYVQDVFEDPARPGHAVEPDDWQKEVLDAVAKNTQLSVASGHGVGKSALSSWVIHWFIATRDHPQIVVTANTASQLTTKTWRELKKWNNKALNGEHFRWTATKFMHKADPETWFAAAVPWSERNSEAFAGTHEAAGVLMLFDEASAIPDMIWEVAAGAMTTEGAKWVTFGNPTRNTGRFRQCFDGGSEAHRWWTMQVDSRNAKMTDKDKLQEWADDWGEDSDFFRVRVRGVFPRASLSQFLPSDLIDRAMARELPPREYYQDAKIIGVDPAKGGPDGGNRHAVSKRQGRKLWAPKSYNGIDTMELVGVVYEEWKVWGADYVAVDGTGVGAGVVARLKELGVPVVDVIVGATANDIYQYANYKTELWGSFRDWLRGDVDIDYSPELKKELEAHDYDHTSRMQVRIESKKYVKQKLGGESPDLADSAVFTMAPDPSKLRRPRVLPVKTKIKMKRKRY